ncbi:peptidase S8/S53 domain-containing protein, partial [Podospora aff. communis PSN243]
DSGVDEWFSFIEDINENILAEFRRQNGRRVRVAVLDTGVDMRNAVFSDREVRRRIKARVDFLDPEGFGLDTCGHGTHCVSLVNRVAPAADIYVGRVACDFDSGVDEEVVAKASPHSDPSPLLLTSACLMHQAIRKALGPKDVDGNWDVDVLSLSFGFPRLSEAIKAALDETHRPDKLILAAASNHGTRRGVAYPASRTGIITIHAADADGRPCNFNPSADPGNSLSILGKNVEAAWTCHGDPTNPASVRRMTGTSVATPIAAGVVSLLLEMTMLDVPGDPATEATLRQMHPMLKTYDGMMAVLTDMTARTQGYHNIVPWNVLDSTKTVANIAKYLREWVLNRRFGM